jgi:hypothetical protein
MTFEEFSLIERLGNNALKAATQLDKLARGKSNTAVETIMELCRVGNLIESRNSSTSTHSAVMMLLAVSREITSSPQAPEINDPSTVMVALEKSMMMTIESNDQSRQIGLRDYLLELGTLCRDRLVKAREAEEYASKRAYTGESFRRSSI